MTAVALTAYQQRWWMTQVVHGHVPTYAVAWRCRAGTTSDDVCRWWRQVMQDDLLGCLRLVAEQPLPLLDAHGAAPEALDAGAGDVTTLATLRTRPWELFRDAGVRASVITGAQILLLVEAHPLVVDEASFATLLARLGRLADGAAAGAPVIPSLTWPAPDLRLVAPWRDHLRGAPPVLDLPLAAGTAGADTALLRRRVVSETASPAAATRLLAAVAAVFQRRTGQDDVVLGWLPDDLPHPHGPLGGTWPVRLDLRDDPSAKMLLDLAANAAAHVRVHHHLPLADLLGHLALPTTTHHPLFQVLVGRATLPGTPALGEVLLLHPAPSGCALTVLMTAQGEVMLEYQPTVSDEPSARALLAQIATAFDHLATSSTIPLSALPLHDETARATMARDAAQVRHFPVTRCLHQTVAEQARRTPQAIALVAGETRMSYGDLDLRANRLAQHLRARGVGPDVPVGLCLPRTADAVVAMLAILKAGGAYVPLDPAHPRERRDATLADCGATVLVSDLAHATGLSAQQTVLVDRDATMIAAQPAEAPATDVSPQHLAYVIYTSGSTGRPKGVPITHAQIGRLFAAMRPWFDFTHDDVWTTFHSFAFDYSVWEIWGALLHGARLVLVGDDHLRAPDAFHALVAREGVTVLSQTPLAFAQFVRSDERAMTTLPALRYVVLGAERLDPATLATWFTRHGDTAPHLVNLYGITETAVISTCRPLSIADAKPGHTSPIGRALPDAPVYLLDRALQPVPVGVIGELFIGGDAVGRGYLNRPDLTTERFIPDPFRPGHRMYRSGDAARLLPDGDIDYIGRLDQQVKIRGYRIEPSEIEAVLRRQPGITECVVGVHQPGNDATGRMLVAYVVSGLVPPAPTLISDLRTMAKAVLPSHMVPAQFVVLERLPMTVNGKLDRRALPPPPDIAPTSGHVAPASTTERKIADAWRQVLGERAIGTQDNFFDLGGNSLRLMQVHGLLQQTFAREIPIVELFQFTTVHALAERLDAAGQAVPVSDPIAERARRQLAAHRRPRTASP